MKERGFALLTVLWLIAALGLITGVVMSAALLGIGTTRNRLGLVRAAWAREACHEILLAWYAKDVQVRRVDTVDLGRGVWCRAVLEDVGTKADINALSAEQWHILLGNDTLVDAVLDWHDADDVERPLGAEQAWYYAQGQRLPRNGPFASVAELGYIRGFDSMKVQALERITTVRGTAQLNLNTAPAAVLQTVPGLTSDAIAVLLTARRIGQPITGPDDLLARLTPPPRAAVLDRYPDFLRQVTFEPRRFIESLEGGIHGTPLISRGWLIVIPTAGRLAVVHREME